MNRTLGLVFVIVGIIGLVVSLLCVPAIWIGRAAAIDYATSATVQATAALQQVQDASTGLRGDIDTLRGPIQQVAGQADAGAASGPVEQQASARLLGLIDQTIGPAYVRLRDAYVNIRDKLSAAAQAAAVLQRLVPALSLPSLPTDDLATVDTQLQVMDESIRTARSDLAAGSLPDAIPGVQTLRGVGDAMRSADARLGTMSTTAGNVAARAQLMQVALLQARASFEQTLNIVAIVLTVFSVNLAVLNTGLFAYGRELRRRTAVTPVASQPAPRVRPEVPTAAPSGVGS
jgi:hypothetical protein